MSAGGPAAGQPRRHQRRQLLRQHADHVHRRPRRQADQLLRPVGLAVPDDGVHLREHRAAAAVRAAGLLAGHVLLRPGRSPALYDPSLAPFIDRDLAEAVQSQRGGTAFVIYPFNRYTRAEVFTRLHPHVRAATRTRRSRSWPISTRSTSTASRSSGNGHMIPLGVSFVQETTIFREFGPVAGSTFKVSLRRIAAVRRQLALAADARRRRPPLHAAGRQRRARPPLQGFKSWGRNPDFIYFGGNSELRGYEYLEFIGQKAFFAQRRTALPAHRGDAHADRRARRPARRACSPTSAAPASTTQSFTFMTDNASSRHADRRLRPGQPITQAARDPATSPAGRFDGLRLVDGRASYGIGLESFLLGFPMHFDWSWKTLFNRAWEDTLFRTCVQVSATRSIAGPTADSFRKMKFSFWIGYDF